jgi:hypothetical protein
MITNEKNKKKNFVGFVLKKINVNFIKPLIKRTLRVEE